MINLKFKWNPPSSGFLGLLAHGGSIVVDGTVVKQFGKDTQPGEKITKLQGDPIYAWREEIVTEINSNRKYKLSYKKYLRRHNLSPSRMWADYFSEKDFQDYQNSGMNLKEWLQKKLEQ